MSQPQVIPIFYEDINETTNERNTRFKRFIANNDLEETSTFILYTDGLLEPERVDIYLTHLIKQ